MRRITRGFTIIELLVVVSVIGILATIVLVGFNRYQTDARDSQRGSQATILAEALEKYYDKNGEYPGCVALTGSASSVTTTVLPGVEQKTLLTPKDPNTETNSIKCQSLAVGGPDVFAYVGDGSSTCSSGGACLQFTLQYLDESTGTIKTITSRRNTNIATSGNISHLAGSVTDLTTANLTWEAIANASSYQIQEATNNSFTVNLVTVSSNTTSLSVSGLVPGQIYYYRVAPIAPSTQGSWSNVVSQTQPTLTTPSVSAVATTFNTYTSSWASVPYALSYNVAYSSDGTNWSGSYSTTSTSYNWGPIGGPGTTMYFRTQAVSGSYTSGWGVASATSPSLNTPVVSASSSSTTSFTESWGAVANATSYNVQCSSDNTTWGSGCQTFGVTTTSFTFSGAASGYTYYVRAQSAASGFTSGWSSSVAVTVPVAAPIGATLTINSSTQATVSWSAVSGASSYTVQYANNSGFSSSASVTGITSTSKIITGLSQGMPEYARVYAVAYGTSSSVSSTVSGTTTIDKPATATLSVDTTTWATGSHHNVNYISYCPSGTSLNPGPDFQGGFGSSGFSAPDYPMHYWHYWGFSDWWDRGNTVPAGSYVRYLTNYTCYTAYTTSPTADTTVNYIMVN
jgi:prepilin-type N-terminal cleavage/methylation domain-containing protein